MDWLFKSSSASDAQVPDTSLRIQTAVAGKVRPIGCGQDRFAAELIWYGDFQSQSQSVGGKGAVFGGGKGGGQTFTYTVAVLFGLCEGPIDAVIQAWDQQNKISLGQLGATVLLGDYSQSPWSYLTSNHPDQADNNRGLAEVGLGPAQLGSSSSLPNWSWEVLHAINNGIAGLPDADPRDWIVGLLSNQYWSVHFPSANIDAMDDYSAWCRSTAMVVTDTLVSAQALNSYLGSIAEATCAEFVWSNGKLRLVPYGDVVVSANGATFTPDLTPVADLGDDDFIELTGGGPSNLSSKVRVQGSRPASIDFDNWVQIQYPNRATDYNKDIVEAKDELGIQLLGYERNKAGIRNYNFFKTQPAALVSAHLLIGRQLVRNQYYFALKRKWLRLDPMDIVTVTDPEAGLDHKVVRIKDITENQDGSFSVQAEEFLQGTGTPYQYDAQALCCINNELQALIADPGPTVFAYWDASLCAVPDGPAIIIAAAGAGDAQFPRFGVKGLISDWVFPKYFHDNPTASGTQTIYKSAPNESGASFELTAIFSGAGANVQIGLAVTATPQGLSPVTITKYADAGPQASIPSGGFGVIASWDFSANTWLMHVRVSAGTVASFSTNEGAPMDEAHPLFQNPALSSGAFGLYEIGDGSATSAMYWGQLWIGLDSDVDALDLTIPDSLWDLFYCNTSGGANAPTNLNSDGSAVMGCPPTFYFDQSPSTGSGGGGAGKSTGCLAGSVFTVVVGTVSAIGAGTIPNCGSYQALGTSLHVSSQMTGPEPFGGTRNIWGSCEVWLSTDAGVTYHRNPDIIPAASAIGALTASYALGVDPDTTDTLSVNLTESLGVLTPYASSDADAGRSRCVIMAEGANTAEIIDYSAASLTAPFKYNLGTYVRRGQQGSAISAHATGAVFAQLGGAAITIKYPVSLIGQTIYVKLPARNKTGGGGQSLADVPAHAIVLAGPGAPVAPATFTAAQTSAGAAVVFNWTASTGCGVTAHTLTYDTGGPPTVVALGNQLSTSLILPPGSYNFSLVAVNSAGQSSGTPATTTLVVT